MEYNRNKRDEDIYSQVIRAGKRTYFFDVKETKTGEKYLVITESRKIFHNDDGKFVYEKSKLFLYREDYEKFLQALENVKIFTDTGFAPTISDEYSFDDDDFFAEV